MRLLDVIILNLMKMHGEHSIKKLFYQIYIHLIPYRACGSKMCGLILRNSRLHCGAGECSLCVKKLM
jgi:hypothetical protein